jgi:chemotaxis-related protein WspB
MKTETEIRNEIERLQACMLDLRRDLSQLVRLEPIAGEAFDVLTCAIDAVGQAAVPLRMVEEVLPMARMAELPEAPPWVCGLLNLAGSLIPVLDVSARLQAAGRRPEAHELVVVCRIDARRVGLVVADAFDVLHVEASTLTATSSDTPHAGYLLGAFEQDSHAVLVLSPQRLIKDSQIPAELLVEATQERSAATTTARQKTP